MTLNGGVHTLKPATLVVFIDNCVTGNGEGKRGQEGHRPRTEASTYGVEQSGSIKEEELKKKKKFCFEYSCKDMIENRDFVFPF